MSSCTCLTKLYAKGLCHSCYDKARHIAKRHSLLSNKRAWYQKNKTEKLASNKRWYAANKKKHQQISKNKRKTDINYRLACNLRSRLNSALQSNSKRGSAVNDLGCSIAELKTWLESKFTTGMCWDNYGFYGWHIDHVKPLKLYDLTDRTQLLEVCNYTNLQPLWAADNIRKRARL